SPGPGARHPRGGRATTVGEPISEWRNRWRTHERPNSRRGAVVPASGVARYRRHSRGGPMTDGLRDAEKAKWQAEALRDAVRDMRAAWRGSWNLHDPLDPEVAYSVDVWLEVRANRIEKGADR